MAMSLTIATLIAQHLGSDWTAKADIDKETGRVWGWKLIGSEEKELHIGTVWNKAERLTISGTYPTEIDGNGQRQDYGSQAIRYNETRPSIEVSGTREPKAIAGEINRRLMPEYIRVLDEAKRRREQHRRYVGGVRAAVDRLAKASKYVKARTSQSGGEPYLDIAGPDHEFYGDVRLSSDGDVSLTLRGISIEVAESILRSLRPKIKAEPGTQAEVDALGSMIAEVNPIR